MNSSRILITCPKAVPPLLKQELVELGLPITDMHAAGVMTEGTMEDCMRLNLWLRTGHRVLWMLHEFEAANADELYAALSEIPWEDHIAEDGYLSVTSSVENPTMRDGRFANLRCKDAIVDRIKKTRGRRPDAGPDRDKVVVFLYWRGRRCAIYFDTTGEPLSKRGYRRSTVTAPMQETLAAALVLATGWNNEEAFVNPMCGSGTLAIEAVLFGLKRAPGLLRDNFSFMHLKGFDRAAWQRLRTEAEAKSARTLGSRVIATDVSPEAVAAARRNAEAAGVRDLIEFSVCDFAATPIPVGGGVVILNPEYGERMGDKIALEPVYERIGEFLRVQCEGCAGFVFTGDAVLAEKIGLKPRRKIPFFNSNIECRLLEYRP